MNTYFYRRVILICLILVYIGKSKSFPETKRQISRSNINAVEIGNSPEFKRPRKLPEKAVKTEATSEKAMFETSSRNSFPSNENLTSVVKWLYGGASGQKRLIRRKRWFWRGDREAEKDNYDIEITTTQQPKKSGWRSWLSNAAAKVKKTYKKAKEKVKKRLKKVGKKIGRGFEKVRNYFTRSEDKFEVFVHKVKERVDQGDEKALDLLNKLGIEVNYDKDGKPVGSTVIESAKDVKEILENRGIYFSGNETVQEPAIKPKKNESSETILPSTARPYSTSTSTPYMCKPSPFSKTTPSVIPTETTTLHATTPYLNGSKEANTLTENLTTSESQPNATSMFSQPVTMETTTPPTLTASSFSSAIVSTSPVLEMLPKTMITKLPQDTPTPSPSKPTLLPKITTHSTLHTKTLPPVATKSSLPSTLPTMPIISSMQSTLQPKSTTSSVPPMVPPETNISSISMTTISDAPMTTTSSPPPTASSSPLTTLSLPFRVTRVRLTSLPVKNISSTAIITTLPPSMNISLLPPTTTTLLTTLPPVFLSKTLSTTRPPTTPLITATLSLITTNSSLLLTTYNPPITNPSTTTTETSPKASMTTTPEQISTRRTTIEPISSMITTPEQIYTTTTTPEEISTTTPTISTTTTSPKPIYTTTTKPEPISTTTTTIEPISSTTLVPTTTESTEPPPFPDIFGDSMVRDRLHEVFLHGDFDHDELRSTFEFDPALYEDYYHYEY